MDYLNQNRELSEKHAADFKHPYELLMEKRRRQDVIKAIEWQALVGGGSFDHRDDDIYEKYISCELNIDETLDMLRKRHTASLRSNKDE